MDGLVLGEATRYVITVDRVTKREVVRIKHGNGCWYKSLDITAGARAYTGKAGAFKFWDGFYNTKATDHYTGAPIDVLVYNASINEYNAYEATLNRVIAALGGELPRAVVADAGYSIEKVYAENTRQGIATVAPFRHGSHKKRERYDTDEYDRHGIPRCRHCGGEGRFVSFLQTPHPRLIFTCAVSCDGGKRQSINCNRKWRLLIPLWRNTEAYMALRDSHLEYEGVHRYWRQRYRVAGNDFYTRPKRIGAAWQQLRASVALLAEWVKICWREGWLGSPRRNPHDPRTRDAADKVKSFINFRIRIGLDKKAAGQSPKSSKAGAGGKDGDGKAPPGGPPAPPPGDPALDIPF